MNTSTRFTLLHYNFKVVYVLCIKWILMFEKKIRHFRSNLLSVLPREICFLPIQVLLVSNNRLVSLPEELGRMERLTELDAACNQITHLPARLSDLNNLRSLSLRNNHLVYLPRGKHCFILDFKFSLSNLIYLIVLAKFIMYKI